MYTQKRNGHTYSLLPIDPPKNSNKGSSLYQYQYPDDPPKDQQYIDKTSTLTSTSQLSFDIFQDGSANTIKMRTKEGEYSSLLYNGKKKDKPPTNIRIIYLITIAELVLFAVSIYKNGGFEPFKDNPMLGPSPQVLRELGANDDKKILENGQWWRFITPIFLHAGLIHLLFNLLFQIQQGVPLEREFGSFRILIIYMISGITGSLMSSIFLPTVLSVGASGALFGLMGAMLAAMVKNWNALRRPCVGILFVSLAIGINLFIGLLPYIDNFAHVGGLVAGLLFGLAIIPSTKSFYVNGILACFGFITTLAALGVGFYLFYTQVDVHDWCTGCKYIDCLPVMGWCDGY